MISNRYIFAIFFGIVCSVASYGQQKFNLPDGETNKIRFKLVGNLIVFPVEVNGVELSFILDSGVSKPILFNLADRDSLQIKNVETIYLRGLGSDGMIQALRSKGNSFRIDSAISVNHDVYVLFDETLNFTPRLGVPVHGIIGYDVFKDFVVEINYSSQYLRLTKPEDYVYKKCKKCKSFPLTFNNNKPYIDAVVEVSENTESVPVKLLIDTGGSDALWLFEDEEKNVVPKQDLYFEDYLGKGLSGNVHGKRSKVSSFELSNFVFNNANVAFPDSASISIAKRYKERGGSISGEILKRFNIIFDYSNRQITLKKNKYFNSDFKYNNSGIILEQIGYRLVKERINKGRISDNSDNRNVVMDLIETYRYSLKPAFTIVELRKDSPAERIGLMKDDIIISVNGKQTKELNLGELIGALSDKNGKIIRLKVERDGNVFNYKFRLEDVFKKKTPKD